MTSGFSSSEAAALERQTDTNNEINITTIEQIWNLEERKKCVDWINSNNYKKICLQFPDDCLVYSESICTDLQNILHKDRDDKSRKKIYILADTSYGSCCVDEIAASHVDADCIIHFGMGCRSETNRLPVLYCFPQLPIDVKQFCQQLSIGKDFLQQKSVTIYLDIGYHDALQVIKNDLNYLNILKQLETKELCIVEYGGDAYGTFSSNGNFHIHSKPPNEQEKRDVDPSNLLFIYVGTDNKRFFHLSLNHKAAKWFIYNPVYTTLKEENPLINKYIRRRFYYIEKCKDAKILGLVVATLTANGYLEVIKRLQTMAKQYGMRTQIISVGRINPAKLANFLEIDCFVLIGCPFDSTTTTTYDSKDFYKPIVTVFEAEMALNPAWHQQYPEIYVTDFKQLLPGGKHFTEFDSTHAVSKDISLINGRVRDWSTLNDNSNQQESSDEQKILCTQNNRVIHSTDALQLKERAWRGLDPNLNNSEPAQLEKGLSGIPIQYTHNWD